MRTKEKKTMSSDTSQASTAVTVEHVLAGLTVWAVLMVVSVVLLPAIF